MSLVPEPEFVTLHGSAMKPKFLLVEAGWMKGVTEEEIILDEIDPGGRGSEPLVLGKELVGENQKGRGLM